MWIKSDQAAPGGSRLIGMRSKLVRYGGKSHRKEANVKEDFFDSGCAEEVFLLVSLFREIFSDWLIFRACRTTIAAISRANTNTVGFFPFFMCERLDFKV